MSRHLVPVAVKVISHQVKYVQQRTKFVDLVSYVRLLPCQLIQQQSVAGGAVQFGPLPL